MTRYIDKDVQQSKQIVGKRATYNPPAGAAVAAPMAAADYAPSRGTKRKARSLDEEEVALTELVAACRTDGVGHPSIASVLHSAFLTLTHLRASRVSGAPQFQLPRFGVSDTAAPGGSSARLVPMGAGRVPKRARRATAQPAAAAGKDADAVPRPRAPKLSKAPRRDKAAEARAAGKRRAVPTERTRGAKAAGNVAAMYATINMQNQGRAGGFNAVAPDTDAMDVS